MKVALHKDYVNAKQYIKDLKICIGEVQEYISKKKDERVFQGIYKILKHTNLFFFGTENRSILNLLC